MICIVKMTTKSEKKVSGSPKGYYSRLSESAKINFRNKVINDCGITLKTFYRWLDNPELIRPPDRKVFSKHAGLSLTDMFKK